MKQGDPAAEPVPPVPLLERFKYLIFLVIGVAVAAGVAVLVFRRPEPVTISVLPPEPTAIPSPTLIPSPTPTPGPYAVYITGAVARPETVATLDYGSRVLHALDAAGGPLANADLERVNLAQVVQDGDHIQVPTRRPGETRGVAPVVRVVTATPGMHTVYVAGEVRQPESLVTVPDGSRVEDAIAAAGGVTERADLSAVNLGQRVADGDMIYVPRLGEDEFQTPTPNRPALVALNSATVAELQMLPGIGPALAQAMVDYREQNGPFTSLDDLDNVPGLGPSKIEAIREQVIFD